MFFFHKQIFIKKNYRRVRLCTLNSMYRNNAYFKNVHLKKYLTVLIGRHHGLLICTTFSVFMEKNKNSLFIQIQNKFK